MTKKKTQEPVTSLQEDKALEILALYNALDSMLDDAAEMFDVNLMITVSVTATQSMREANV